MELIHIENILFYKPVKEHKREDERFRFLQSIQPIKRTTRVAFTHGKKFCSWDKLNEESSVTKATNGRIFTLVLCAIYGSH